MTTLPNKISRPRDHAIDAVQNKSLRPLFIAASACMPLISFFYLFNILFIYSFTIQLNPSKQIYFSYY